MSPRMSAPAARGAGIFATAVSATMSLLIGLARCVTGIGVRTPIVSRVAVAKSVGLMGMPRSVVAWPLWTAVNGTTRGRGGSGGFPVRIARTILTVVRFVGLMGMPRSVVAWRLWI